MNLEIKIPSDEPVRLLSAVAEELDYRRLTATYSRPGRIEYSLRLLFKIVMYGCSRGIYKTREIERACRENINFMYLLEGRPAPDHNTIARFRREHLPYGVENLLTQMVKLLAVSDTGITVPSQVTIQKLKKLRKQLYAKKLANNVTFVRGKEHHKSGLQKAIETINSWLERLKRYNLDIHICGDRNSYSKTDPDATFMHMKEDHMKDGQ